MTERACRWTGVSALVGGGCVVHGGSDECLLDVREMWAAWKEGEMTKRGTERDLMAATELLVEFHRTVLSGEGVDGDFGYAGSPFQRRVLAFLGKRGKSVVPKSLIG